MTSRLSERDNPESKRLNRQPVQKSARTSRGARQAARRELRRGRENVSNSVAVAGAAEVDRIEPRLTVTRIDQQYRASDAVAIPRTPPVERNPRGKVSREKAARTPAIWHGGAKPTAEAERAPAEHVEGRGAVRWRVVSGILLLVLTVALIVLFVSDSSYVRPANIVINGLESMTREEVYALTNVSDMHIFWVDPALVRAGLLRSPTIADAQVFTSWAPNMVQIVIYEREPAFLWQRGDITTWIDLQGRVMRQRGERAGLPRLLDESSTARDRVDLAIVNGALQIYQLMPNISELRFTDAGGLGYVDERGWDIWFGVGTNMPEKILIYNAIVDDLTQRGITPVIINVTNPDAPYYTLR